MKPTPTQRSAMRWPTRALVGALALAAASLLPGCQFGTLSGDTYTGSNIGRSLYFAGYASSPNANMTVQVLNDPTADPYTSGVHWVDIGSTSSSSTAYTDSAGNDWYAYYLYVTPVPSSAVDHRWPAGGVVRLRTLQDGGTIMTYDEDFYTCSSGLLGDLINVGLQCGSPTSPVNGVVDTDPMSAATDPYLSERETAAIETNQYYLQVLAGPAQVRYTFAGWLTVNGFPGSGEVTAKYFNDGDLGFGREMHCRPTAYNEGYACYVTNYLDSSISATLEDLIAGEDALATVAMEYWPNAAHDKVRFFVYDGAGARLNALALDSEGDKNVPGLCLSCHGGTYNNATNQVTDAKFLPFDIYSFLYSTDVGYTRSDQEEAFRQLNEIVNDTDPTVAIAELIDGWYGGNVSVPLTTVDDTFIPTGWSGSAKEEMLYKKVVEDYCRSCHIALESYRDWDTFAEFSAYSSVIETEVCTDHDMPHAERTREHFWESPARAHLLNALKLPTTCD